MKAKSLSQKLLFHFAVVALFFMAVFFFFRPTMIGNKSLEEGDNVQARAVQNEMREYKDKEGELPLWTNQVFVGMPTYQIMAKRLSTPVLFMSQLVRFGQGVSTPHTMMFWGMLSLYIALLLMGVDWRLGALGGLAFGLMTHNMLLLEAGHSTKIFALTFVAPMFASAVLAFRKRYLLGGGLFALFFALQIHANHFQITYYTGLLLAIMGIAYLVKAIREGELVAFAKTAGVLVVAAVLALGSNVAILWATNQYVSESIRGKSELTQKEVKEGLTPDYAFRWSYSPGETFTLVVPNFYGGSSDELLAYLEGSETEKVVQQVARSIPQEQQRQVLMATTRYWGQQDFTTGPAYFGAAVVFLFFLGLVLWKHPLRWWLGIGSLFFVVLSWGSNFAAFNEGFMFNYFPFYNKFRAVSMTISVLQILVLFGAVFGLQAFFSSKYSSETKLKALGLATAIAGSIGLYALARSFTSEAIDPQMAQMFSQGGLGSLVDAIAADRKSLLQTDALRTLFFILGSAAVLWLYLKKGLQLWLAVVGLAVLIAVDLAGVSKRFINNESFKERQEVRGGPPAAPAQQQIMADTDPHFRVMDLSSNNAIAAYYYKIVGGYHAAKPMLYQEVSDKYLIDSEQGRYVFQEYPQVLDMINAKYLVFPNQGQIAAQPRPTACGNAWLVSEVQVVKNADEELAALANFDPKKTAIVQEKHAQGLEGLGGGQGSIALSSYHPEKMVYSFNSPSKQLAVFSEIYYPPSKGWKVFIDGQKVTEGYRKVNYLLRGLVVPAGEHTIEMRFEPAPYYEGATVEWASNILLVLLLGTGLFWYYKKGEPLEVEELEEQLVTTAPAKTTKRKAQPQKKGKRKK